MFNKILIVCVGNICRSPMAEYIFKQAMPNRTITSAGIGALVGHQADPMVIKLLQEKGIDATEHRARQLSEEMVTEADLILVMEGWQQKEIVKRYPYTRGKVLRLGQWDDFDVPDPYQQAENIFRYSLELIENGLKTWQQKL